MPRPISPSSSSAISWSDSCSRLEVAYRPPLWLHAALWLPLTVLLSLAVLPIIKGALVGLQWALLMHGFDPNAEEDTYEPFDEGTGRS